jgi:hypothetical protein
MWPLANTYAMSLSFGGVLTTTSRSPFDRSWIFVVDMDSTAHVQRGVKIERVEYNYIAPGKAAGRPKWFS